MGICVRIWSLADGDDSDGDVAMVMMATVMSSVMVVIVPEALRQVGWPRQR